jgi:predicted RND superfamily exporter protein
MSAFSRFAEKVVFGSRPAVLIVFAVVTLLMAIMATQLKVDAGFKKQIPLEHEYMKTFLDYEQDFGGANRVLVAVMANDGNIFDQTYMATLEKVTNDVINLDATDDARVRSLFTPNVRFIEVVEDGLAGGNVIPQDFSPNTTGFVAKSEQFATIRSNIVKANIVGRFVAKDFSGAMIWADLIPENAGPKPLNYQDISHQLDAMRAKYETDPASCRAVEQGKAVPGAKGVCVRIIGFAKMVGDITDGAISVIKFFAITIAFTWLLLFLYSSSVKLASLTVLSALISVIWMLGALKLMGFGIDPMNMLTPFLIFAIAVSHGEQMINRFRGEIFFGGLEEGSVAELRERAKFAVPPLEAARLSFRMLLVPGAVALLAGCIGFGAIWFIPIQMIKELAITATVGVAITILTDLILLPVLLSYTRLRNLNKKREFRLRQLTQFDKIWLALSKLSRPSAAMGVIIIGAVVWFFAWQYGNKVMVGDAQKGVAELKADARYNVDAGVISSKFALGVDILSVIAEAEPGACTSSYKAMETIDRFRLAHAERGRRRTGTDPADGRQDRQRRLERRLGALARAAARPRYPASGDPELRDRFGPAQCRLQRHPGDDLHFRPPGHDDHARGRCGQGVPRPEQGVFAGRQPAHPDHRQAQGRSGLSHRPDQPAPGDRQCRRHGGDQRHRDRERALHPVPAVRRRVRDVPDQLPQPARRVVHPAAPGAGDRTGSLADGVPGHRHEDQHPVRGGARRRHRRRLRHLHLRPHARGNELGQDAQRVVLHCAQDHRHRDLLHRADPGRGRGDVDVLRPEVPGRHGHHAHLHVRGEHDRRDRVPAGAVPVDPASDRERRLDASRRARG